MDRFWRSLESLAVARAAPRRRRIGDADLSNDPARSAMPGTFRLDGAQGHGDLGERTFAGHSPLAFFTLENGAWHVTSSSLRVRASVPFEIDAPFAPLERAAAIARAPGRGPFEGALVGYLSYELGERLLGLTPRAGDTPLAMLALHDCIARRRGSTWLVTDTGLRQRSDRELDAWCAALPSLSRAAGAGSSPPEIRLTRESLAGEAYARALLTVKALIGAGEIYQANLTRLLTLELDRDAAAFHRDLIRHHPAPFACHLVEPGGAVIAGISPELFLRVRGREVETRPIKGTRPRGRDAAHDVALRRELLASEKDAAELVMIVDLMRNDLGRVAEIGSVSVPEVKRLDTHPSLHHLSGVVTARLRTGASVWDLLAAALPAGSVTGAPKRRAAQILAELEPHERGVYTGAVGLVDFRGDAILNVAIRTARIIGRSAVLGVGGGIVADSDPVDEFEETRDKARAFFLGAERPAPTP